ncbi:hypothetical protein [Streptomyces sp. NBC_01439]|uniref:hypothetical protein n=1 Tax=Streptomyces sp. NBC_01439 TaxID=2903867 RepID=UPI003FCD0371
MLLGCAWADPIAALVIASVAVKEGRDAWRGESCCGPMPVGDAIKPGETEANCTCPPGCDCC